MNFYGQEKRSLQIYSDLFSDPLFLLTDVEGAEQGLTLNTGGQISMTPGKIHLSAKTILIGDEGAGLVERNALALVHITPVKKDTDKTQYKILLSHLPSIKRK